MRFLLKAIAPAAAGLALALTAAAASASPVLFCKDGPGIDLVNDGCISGSARGYPGGGDGVFSNSGGGDPESAVEAAILGATGVAVDIELFGKSDDNPGLFSFSAGPDGQNSGTWDVLDNLVGIAFITVKASNSFALYDVGGANSGSFTTEGILNNGGQQPGVSHISFWTGPGGSSVVLVPLPVALPLFASALIGTGFLVRRRVKS